MHDKGIPVAGTTIRPSVTTYTIDVYNKQPNAQHTSLMLSMAKAGGGRYFAAKNEEAIIDALQARSWSKSRRSTPASPRPACRSTPPTARRT